MNNYSFQKDTGQFYGNDIQDFQMPYQMYGSTDYELMKQKYLKLTNNSYGYVLRAVESKNFH